MSLCAVLPGPTSTQTIVSVGYKMGGPRLAALTMLVWALPIVLVMGALKLCLHSPGFTGNRLRAPALCPALAGGLASLVAAFRIGKKVLINWRTGLLFALSALLTFFFRTPWLFPLMLLAGGAWRF
jgi:chromate transporter